MVTDLGQIRILFSFKYLKCSWFSSPGMLIMLSRSMQFWDYSIGSIVPDKLNQAHNMHSTQVWIVMRSSSVKSIYSNVWSVCMIVNWRVVRWSILQHSYSILGVTIEMVNCACLCASPCWEKPHHANCRQERFKLELAAPVHHLRASLPVGPPLLQCVTTIFRNCQLCHLELPHTPSWSMHRCLTQAKWAIQQPG